MTTGSLISKIFWAGTIAAAVSANAGTILVDFGSGAGVDGSLTAYSSTGNASIGTSLNLGTSLSVANGALTVTVTGGNRIFCQQGTNVGFCGTTTGASTNPQNASGIGVGNNSQTGNSPSRVDSGERLVFTVNPGFVVTLLQFSVTEFGTPEGGESANYIVNGGAPITFSPQAPALDTFDPTDFAFNTLSFGAQNGTDYALSSLQLDVVSSVPEPGTFALFAAGISGLVALRRRKSA